MYKRQVYNHNLLYHGCIPLEEDGSFETVSYTHLDVYKRQFEGYKGHSKICLITYRHRNEIQYITQIGTGNYNEKTAEMYTDVSLMTSSRSIGEDAAEFFKNMSISNLDGRYEELIVAPTSLKQKILLLIDREIAKGTNGRIVMKMN